MLSAVPAASNFPSRRTRQARSLLATLLVLLTGIAGLGLARLTFTDDYRSFFQSNGAAFARLDEVSTLFGTEENDLMVVAEAEDVLAEDALRTLRHVADDARRVAGVEAVYFLSSLPELHEAGGAVRPPGAGRARRELRGCRPASRPGGRLRLPAASWAQRDLHRVDQR